MPTTRATIHNTIPRRDRDGDIIDAHDGCLEQFGPRFYLYGTAYGATSGFTTANRYVCYSSPDLLDWTFHGSLFAAQPDGVMYRPAVKYNRGTGKFVLWFNWYPTLWHGQSGVAIADTPEGPFTIQQPAVHMRYAQPGDHSLLIDDDGTGYLIYTSIATEHGISIEQLTDDYLASTHKNSGILATGCEAPVLLKRDHSYYALFDACCCFCPVGSGAQVHVAAHPLASYRLIGNINRADGQVIVAAQQAHVATIQRGGRTRYVWIGDRWGSTPDGIKGHDFQIWLPLDFDERGQPQPLGMRDSWTLEFAES